MTVVSYSVAGPTLEAFFASDAFVRVLIGPFGSGKTSACCAEAFRRCREQAPDQNGVRRSKGVVIRSTFRQLNSTTVPSWRGWFGDAFGRFSWSEPYEHRLRFGLEDGTRVEADVQFLALDGPDAEEKLRGLEATWAWVNEARELPKPVFSFLLGRIGRYPPMRDGGPTWSGVFCDTNSMDTDDWLHKLLEERPEGWLSLRQPGGVLWDAGRWVPNPQAENLGNLPAGYYERQLAGQSNDWIRVYLANEPGYVLDGRPVYPEFFASVHVAPEPVAPVPGVPVVIGLDFGLTPAAVFCQRTPNGRWLVLAELVAEDMGAVRFSEQLAAHIAAWLPDYQCAAWGDPADSRSQTDERSCLDIVRAVAKIPAQKAPTNSFVPRREAVASALNRLVDGKAGFLLSPACSMLRKGFAGGYHYRRVKITGDERYHDQPDKNAYSHPHDALQYALSGGGEVRALTAPRVATAAQRPVQAQTEFSPW